MPILADYDRRAGDVPCACAYTFVVRLFGWRISGAGEANHGVGGFQSFQR